jgi:hypothetical protein
MSDYIFRECAPALLSNGFSPLPIVPNSKKPGIKYPMSGWTKYCEAPASADEISEWSQHANCGIGVACGYQGLLAVDIDNDGIVDPVLAVLPPYSVAKKGSKGLTIFYRCEDDLPTKQFKANGSVLAEILALGRQTVLPPTIHKDTGAPYIWTTNLTLLNTPISDLPAFTEADFEALAAVCERFGSSNTGKSRKASKRPKAAQLDSGPARPFDEINTAALNNIGAWIHGIGLTRLKSQGIGYRAVAHWRSSGTGRGTSKRETNLSIHPRGIRDWGADKGYTPVQLVAKALELNDVGARAWLRDRLGMAPSSISPKYQDTRQPLSKAASQIASCIGEFLRSTVPAANSKMAEYDEQRAAWREKRGVHPIWYPQMPAWVIKVEPGVGKTHSAIAAVTEYIGDLRQVVYATSQHNLIDQIVGDLRANGIDAAPYRGATKPDRLHPEREMCRDLPAYNIAKELKLNIRKAICVRQVGAETKRCAFADNCGMERQRRETHKVWVVPSALLLKERVPFIDTPDVLFIDEAFISSCIQKPQKLSIASLLENGLADLGGKELEVLRDGRKRLVRALSAKQNERMEMALASKDPLQIEQAHRRTRIGDSVSRAHLVQQALNWEGADYMSVLELHGRADALVPGMSEDLRGEAMNNFKDRNQAAINRSVLWSIVSEYLCGTDYAPHPDSHCGRITVKGDSVEFSQFLPVHETWRVPTLILDATAPPKKLLEAALNAAEILEPVVVEKANVTAFWSEHVMVRQIVSAPVSKSKLGLIADKKTPLNDRDILRFIQNRAAQLAPAKLGLISYKELIAKVGKLPGNVKQKHFGALSGMNDMQDVEGLLIIGRQLPSLASINQDASVFTDSPIMTDSDYFNRKAAGIRLRDGTVFETIVDEHPNEMAEALRWLACEGQLIQALGRLRAHRREAACWIEIVCDVPLPIIVDEVLIWQKPSSIADMLRAGIVLDNSRHAQDVLGMSRRQGMASAKTSQLDSLPYKSINRQVSPTAGGLRFRYRIDEPRNGENTGTVLPSVLLGSSNWTPDELEAQLRLRLEVKIGKLAYLRISPPATETPFSNSTYQATAGMLSRAPEIIVPPPS